MDELVGQGIVVYGQTEIVKDLIAAQIESGLPLHLEAPLEDVDAESGVIRSAGRPVTRKAGFQGAGSLVWGRFTRRGLLHA